jgi:rSAM/selenodomain-associated transferase 2
VKLSIIIPAYNEASVIGQLVNYLLLNTSAETEVIVADGGSTDNTLSIALEAGAISILCKHRGRGAQMNEGAALAKGEILYFLHADTFPPRQFEEQIKQAVQNGQASGCFRLRFDEPHWFLKLNAWFTRFDIDAIRFGDQSLFVKKNIFEAVGGFNENLLLLEDQEIISRLRSRASFIVLPSSVITSARKYKDVGIFKLQAGYFLIYCLYRLKISQHKLWSVYRWLLNK